jgi:hypothetical protein
MAVLSPVRMGPVAPQYAFSTLPRHALQFAESAAPQSGDAVALSAEAETAGLSSGPDTLRLFGGDRKQAIETLIASGAKAENPKLGFFKNVLRKFAGDKTKTVSKPISAEQTIGTEVKVKNFRLKGLRLSTRSVDGDKINLRHIDFAPTTPAGRRAQVKDVGTVIGKGRAKRLTEQEVTRPADGKRGRIRNSYFDPKTGQKFLQRNEESPRLEKNKMGTFRSRKSRETERRIELLNAEGKVHQRYTFDYGRKDYRLESLSADGQVTSSEELSRKTDYWKLVNRLSLNPPSRDA